MSGVAAALLADRSLCAIVFAASLSSGGAIVLHAAGVLPMAFTVGALALPGLLVTLGVAALGHRRRRERFMGRLGLGVIAGLAATVAYDLGRVAIQRGGLLDVDPFRALPIFGSLMLGLPAERWESQFAGALYHFWNGVSFAVMYALIARGAVWYWGVAYALTLESFMLWTYPIVVGIARETPFVAMSIAGHVMYGATLGVIVERAGRGS